MKIVEREIKDTKGCDERRHVSCLTSPVVSRLTSHAPTPWPKVKLGEIADLDLGKMLDQKKNKGTPRHYLANIDVRWGYFNLGNLKEMLFKDSELERYGLRYGDIVMCEGGEPGRCARGHRFQIFVLLLFVAWAEKWFRRTIYGLND